jgi:sn-glycerol 3-phosphate transport system substrate-binding protein
MRRGTQTLAATLLAAALAAPAAKADVQLTMYYPIAVGGPLTEVVDQRVADFEAEHPDISVNAIYAGNYDDTRVRALSALASGEPVQLSVLFSIDVFELIEQDAIVAFDEIMADGEAQAWFDSFYPALMANGIVDDQVWGIPFQRSTIVLYYNKEAFEEAGLDPETPPATWDEMVLAAKALTADGRYGLMVPSTGYPYWMFQALAIQNGVELMSRDGTETYFADPAVIEALEFWVSLSQEHEVMPSGTIEWGTLRQNFVERQTAMMWHTTGNLTAVRNEADFDFGVAMLPANQRPGSPTGGGNFYIFKGASEAEREAALTFIQWMTEPERAARWSIATGYVGISPASYETEALREYVEEFPEAVVARDQLEVAVPELATYEAGRVREALNTAIQASLTGRQEPKQALTEAQATADRLLQPYR